MRSLKILAEGQPHVGVGECTCSEAVTEKVSSPNDLRQTVEANKKLEW